MMTLGLVGATRDELEARAARLLALMGDPPGPWLRRDVEAGFGRAWWRAAQVLEQLSALAAAGLTRIMFQHLLHDDLDAVALIRKGHDPSSPLTSEEVGDLRN